MSDFQRPMQVWPELAHAARRVRLEAFDLTLHCLVAGPEHGPALLLLHGLGDESDTWRHVFAPLAETYRVVAPDLPGFGRSDLLKPVTMPALRDVMFALLDALGIDTVSIVGSSLGGMLAHYMALGQPERVRKLVLLDGGLVSVKTSMTPRTMAFLVPVLGEWVYNGLRRNPQTTYETLYPYYADLDALPQADRDFLYQRVNERVWSDKQRDGFMAVLRSLVRWLPGQQAALTAAVSELTVPTLVVWGEHDQINAIENGRALVEAQPSATLHVLDGVGHLPQQEAPDVLLSVLADFLR